MFLLIQHLVNKNYRAYTSFQILRQQYHIHDGKMMLQILEIFSVDLEHITESHHVARAS